MSFALAVETMMLRIIFTVVNPTMGLPKPPR